MMEFVNENLHSVNNPNLQKSKPLSFSNIKRSTKTALSDVRNTIHLKNLDNRDSQFNKSGTSKCNLIVDELDRDLKSPSPRQKKQTSLKSRKTDVDRMSDNCFTNCRCCAPFDINDLYTLPEDLCLSKETIDFFATNWVNKCPDTVDKTLLLSSVEIEEGVLQDMADSAFSSIMCEDEAYLNMLDESFDLDLVDMYIAGTV